MTELSLSVQGVTVEFDEHEALQDVSFEVGAGSLVGVLGPNGAGKSTLFNVMAGLQPVRRGSVSIRGADQKKGALAYVPQRESVNWSFPVTAHDVVTMGRTRNAGWLRRPSGKDRQLVAESLERVGLWEHRGALMSELSGGQRQRVFVARALAQQAVVFLLDEAFSGVDVGAQAGLVSTLHSLRDEGYIVLLATHDLTNLSQRFDEVLCINHHVCAFGPPDQVFTPEVLQELYGSHGITFATAGDHEWEEHEQDHFTHDH